jgi:hypothetical protein
MELSQFALGIAFAMAGVFPIAAQEKTAEIPKVLQITREYVKAGRAGAAHEKTESVFVEAERRAKWPTYYIGLTSLSGRSRALFLTSYASFEAWQKDSEAMAKNTALSSTIDRAYMADGDLLEGLDQGVFYYSEAKSFHPRADLSPFRYMEFTLFKVKPGKDEEWDEVVKLAKTGYEKGMPDAHWGMFQLAFGGDGGTYLAITGHKSLAEIDQGFAQGKQFAAVLGEDGMKKLNEMFASCVESTSQQLFAVNPQMSYVSDEWIKSDPEFWQTKPPTAKAAEAKKKP